MATLQLPRSLVALFPGAPRRLEVDGGDVSQVLAGLERAVPGTWDRLVDVGPVIRAHIKVYVDGEPASLDSPVGAGSTVMIVPAVSGG